MRGVESYMGLGDVGGRLDPLDRVANLLDGIDERADVAGDVVEEVHCRHGGWVGEEGAIRVKMNVKMSGLPRAASLFGRVGQKDASCA